MLSGAAAPQGACTLQPSVRHPVFRQTSASSVTGSRTVLSRRSSMAVPSQDGVVATALYTQPAFRCQANGSCAEPRAGTAATRCMRASRPMRTARRRGSTTPHAVASVPWEPADRRQPWWGRNVLVRNAELLQRLAWTALLAALMRVGCFIPLPDIARAAAPAASGWAGQLLHSAAEVPANLFEVGFAPYFGVTILMAVLVGNAQWLGLAFLESWREGGSEGRASFERTTNVLTAVVGLFLGWRAGLRYLPNALVQQHRLFVWAIAAQLTAGTCILIWLCNWVKDKGLSDGYSLVFGLNIAAGIAAHVAHALPVVIKAAVPPCFYAQCAAAYAGLTLAAVVLTRTELQLPLVHFRTQRPEKAAPRGRAPEAADDLVVRDTGLDGKPLGGLSYSDTLPLRMCPGGMMSLIYASVILATLGGRVFNMNMLAVWGLGKHVAYCCALCVTVCVMELVGKVMADTPGGIAKSLVQLDVGIRGKAPGPDTAAYIRALDGQLRVIGGCAMGLLAVAAHAFDAWCMTRVGVTAASSSLLLLASLASGTITQVRTLLQKPALQKLMQRETEALQLM